MTWIYKKYEQLSLQQLYDIIALRQEVFVVEQDCPYLDADGKDQQAFHLSGYVNSDLAVYARITFPGVRFPEVSIGRIVSSNKYRGKGYGKAIMKESIRCIEKEYGKVPVRLSAQTYLINFYGQFGFEPVGEEYLEDNIPHVEMLRMVD